jgi:hypothetical protein
MTRISKTIRSIAIALTLSGVALGSLAVSGALQNTVFIADGSGQRGDWDPG